MTLWRMTFRPPGRGVQPVATIGGRRHSNLIGRRSSCYAIRPKRTKANGGGGSMRRHQPTKIVGYLRTSTEDQLLGIDAQDAAARPRWPDTRDVTSFRQVYRARVGREQRAAGARQGPPPCPPAQGLPGDRQLDRLARDQQFLMRLVDGIRPADLRRPPGSRDLHRRGPDDLLQVFGAVAEVRSGGGSATGPGRGAWRSSRPGGSSQVAAARNAATSRPTPGPGGRHGRQESHRPRHRGAERRGGDRRG